MQLGQRFPRSAGSGEVRRLLTSSWPWPDLHRAAAAGHQTCQTQPVTFLGTAIWSLAVCTITVVIIIIDTFGLKTSFSIIWSESFDVSNGSSFQSLPELCAQVTACQGPAAVLTTLARTWSQPSLCPLSSANHRLRLRHGRCLSESEAAEWSVIVN